MAHPPLTQVLLGAASLALLGHFAPPAIGQVPAAVAAPLRGAPGDVPIPDPPSPRLVPLEVVLNGANVGNWLLLHAPGGFYAAREALDAWRIRPRAEGERLNFQNENWYALSSIDGYVVQLNPARQAIELSFSPSAFVATQLTEAEQDAPALSTTAPALFVNYDLNWNHTRTSGIAPSKELGALTELGFTSQLGVLTSSFLGRHVENTNIGQSGAQWRRLETTFTRDFPDRKLSVRLGDTTTRTGLLGRQIYFGGIQLARNFDLAPGFISQPLPVISGSSSVPSTVELYINDALRQTLNVPAGPFTIQNPMPVSGDGRARMVVRDVLGRETVITQSFFTHAQLLEAGLSDWSVELGAVRNNLGVASADYGERFAAGLWRYGLSKRLTMEAHGEWGENTRGLGVGISQALPWQALGQASLAWSEQDGMGRGLQWTIGGEYGNAAQAYTLQAQGATPGYRTVGLNNTMDPPRWQMAGSFSHTHERFGTFGLGLARLNSRQQGTLSTYSLSHSLRVGLQGSLNFVFTQLSGATSGKLFAVSMLWPLENQINTALQVMQRNGQTDAYASASQGLRADTGLGWRVLGGTRNGRALSEGGIYLQGTRQLLTADASMSAGQQSLRLGTQGGFVLMGGRLFASRPVHESFALVDVGVPDIGLTFQGREQTRTDAQGQALLVGLQPYNTNSVRLNPSDLPLSAEIDSLEQVTVPRLRSAVRLNFPVRMGQAALLTVLLRDGQPAPAGAEIERLGDAAKRFPVGRGGQAFVTGLQSEQQLRLHWNNASCLMSLTLPPGSPDDVARPKPLVCEGVSP
jgi:outer membrane usher protein